VNILWTDMLSLDGFNADERTLCVNIPFAGKCVLLFIATALYNIHVFEKHRR